MEWVYRYDDEVTAGELSDLMDRMETVMDEPFPARDVFHRALRCREKEAISLDSTIAVTARDSEGALAGYLRVLTDGAYLYYILDVMVDPACRRCGIGTRLVQMAVDESKRGGFIKIFLTALPGKEPFYERFGFKPSLSPVLTLRGEDYEAPS